MSRIGYLVLSILAKNEAFGQASAMTAREISSSEDFGYKPNTIYKAVAHFLEGGYVATGYKDGRQNTYFITEKGQKLLQGA